MISRFAPLQRLALPVLLLTFIGQFIRTDVRAEAALGVETGESSMFSRSLVSTGDLARLQHALAKARRGEAVTIGVIGGSITQGAGASQPARRYGERVAAWWQQTFPKASIRFVNAGIGATGSDYGALRVKRDLLSHHPDFVIVEYAVNDLDTQAAAETLEGLLRQILRETSQPAVLLLFTMHQDGGNAQEWQDKVGRHYELPMVSFRDALWPEIKEGRIKWNDVEADVVHPNDRGHDYCARFITRLLERVLADLPSDDRLSQIKTVPQPLLSDLFEHVTLLEADALKPLNNQGWSCEAGQVGDKYWKADAPGSVIEFEVAGQAILFMDWHIHGPMGQASVRVDDRPPVLQDAWFDQTWGGYRQTTLLARDLGPGKHRVRVELRPENNPQSSGHEFRVLGFGTAGADRPTLEVTAPKTVITQSCRVVIPQGLVFRDTNDQGVIIIGAPNIEIEFAQGSVLRGSPADARPDEYKGYGIRLNGHAGVTIRGARISGFWCGLWATKADGLTLEGIDASDNRRAYLKSTPVAEDGGDWLFGHDNDQHEWLKNYGAALYLEDSAGVTVRDSRVWHGQNALCLDRVTASSIYDNDFSFNSGWGIALWRCARNVISRNAVDFCVRGYSHGVYNRGQDSAGIFVFEQNNDNVFAENSVTHGGDGFFGFAGRESLGEIGEHPVEWYKRRGNTDNLLIGNDLSYAVAHGIENTFSFGNKYLKNRIVGNAICGIWAGYSRETLIAGNAIAGNGEMGYGLERGGVNIDHGGDNLILHNSFMMNKCGVHLWGGANPDFEKKNWAKANGYASTGSVIADNIFDGDSVAFQFRGPGQVTLGQNKLVEVGKEMMADPAYRVIRDDHRSVGPLLVPEHKVFGKTRPVGARPELSGRENIVMTEWGPWDHVTPLVRLVKSAGGTAQFEVLKVPSEDVRMETVGDQVRAVLAPVPGKADESQVTVSAVEPGVRPYVLKVQVAGKPLAEMKGTLLATTWQATFFKWPTNADPRTNLAHYRKLAEGPTAVAAQLDELSLRYGMRGPSDLGISDKVTAAKFGRDHFGMIARTRLPLAKGTWEFSTLSDDGVRVSVDGKPVIENWAWHGPTSDAGKLTLPADKTVEIEVEHFQIDGYAVLEFSLSRQAEPAPAKEAGR
jgi:parallel beta-helix repeat protein